VELAGPVHLLKGDPWANWYALLNAGFRIALAGASGKASNRALIGQSRTYAHLGGEPWSYAAWIEAVRAGKTCISEGPFIDLQVDGKLPGAMLSVPVDPRTRVQASIGPLDSMGALEIVANGVVRVQQVATAGASISITAELDPGGLRWIAARYRRSDGAFVAHTSPIYFPDQAGSPGAAMGRLKALRELLLRGASWAATKAAFRVERNRAGLVSTFREAALALEKCVH
jgi:hypothetical protein